MNFFQRIETNWQKTAQLFLKGSEIAFNIYFLMSLKVPQEPIYKYNGHILRQALLVAKDLEFNYRFGKETREVRYLLSLIMVPALVTNCLRLHTFQGLILLVFTLFQILTMVDLINTNQNWTCYYMVLSMNVFRFLDQIKDLYNLLPSIRPKITIIQEDQKEEEQITQIKSKSKISSVNEKIFQDDKKTSQLFLRQSKEKDSLLVKQAESTDCSSGSSNQTTNSDQKIKEYSNKRDLQPSRQLKISKLPPIEMKVRTQGNKFTIRLENPFKFDEAFRGLDSLNETESLDIKIHFCSLVLRIAKNRERNNNFLIEHITRQILKYQVSLLLLNKSD